jgi:hypothetical protein
MISDSLPLQKLQTFYDRSIVSVAFFNVGLTSSEMSSQEAKARVVVF